jgi:glycosyltransferase involved in cell wall biosynthesis
MKYTVYFPDYKPVHEYKDVGMIPRLLRQRYGVDSKIISSSLPGLLKRFLKGERYDVFQVYHYKYQSIIAGFVYHLFNPRGILYMKLDTSSPDVDNKMSLSRPLFKLARFNLVSAEHDYIKTFKGQEVLYLPNFVEVPNIRKAKNDVIIHVGRLGAPERQTEQAINQFNELSARHPSWSLLLVGEPAPGFKASYNEITNERIYYAGNITDRDRLYDIMAKSKIIFMPSTTESYGYSVVEAMSLGCVLVGTDLPAYREHTNNGQYGFLDCNLEAALSCDLSRKSDMSRRYVRERYLPDNIQRLWDKIQSMVEVI